MIIDEWCFSKTQEVDISKLFMKRKKGPTDLNFDFLSSDFQQKLALTPDLQISFWEPKYLQIYKKKKTPRTGPIAFWNLNTYQMSLLYMAKKKAF